MRDRLAIRTENTVKCSDVIGNHFEWLLGENNAIKDPLPHTSLPANTTHRPDVGPMLGRRRRRWPNIGPTSGRCVVFAGLY